MQPILDRMTAAELLRCLEILAAARFTPPDTWLGDFLHASEVRLPSADATEVYGMLTAMRVLRLRPQRWQWAENAAAVLSTNLPQLSAPQVIRLLVCLADLALPPPEGLLGRAFALIAPDLPALPPRASLNLFAACSKLRRTPPPHVLAKAYEALSEQALQAAPPAQLYRLAAAMAALRLTPPPWLLKALVDRTDALLRSAAERGSITSTGLALAMERDAALGSTRVLRPGRQKRTSPMAVTNSAAAAERPSPAAAKLTPPQLSCLLRDLRTLAAPLPADWGGLCGAFLAARLDASAAAQEVQPVLFLLGSVARCGLELEPVVVRRAAAWLDASLRAACEQRRRARELQQEGRERQTQAAHAVMDAAAQALWKDQEEELLALDGGVGSSRSGHRTPASMPASGETQLRQWTPEMLSAAAITLVPYAPLLPPSLLRALYVNLYDTLECFDLPHLTSTLHSLPLLAAPAAAAPPPPAPLLRSYLSCLLGRMRRMESWQLSMCLFALLRLRVRPDPSWMDAILGRVYVMLPRMNEMQIATIAWVVAKMSYRPAARWMKRLLTAASGRLSCFSSRHLGQLLWAVGAMGYVPEQAWMDRWLDKARGHFRTSDGPTLAALTWALAGSGHRPADAWMQELCDHLARRLPYTPPRAVANTLAALAKLGYRPGPDWLRAVEAHVQSRLAPLPGGSAAAAHADGGCYDLQDLAHVCHSLSRLQHVPMGDWVRAVAGAAARLALLGPAGHAARGVEGTGTEREGTAAAELAAAGTHARYIALLLLALARFGVPPSPDAWRALLEGLHPCLPAAPPQSLAVLVAAAASLRLPLPREHAGALLLATHRRLAAMSGRGLALALRGWVELGVHPGARWLGRLEEVLRWRTEQERERRAQQTEEGGEEDAALLSGLLPSPAERCTMLWAVATLETSRLADDPAIEAWRPAGLLYPRHLQQPPGFPTPSSSAGPHGYPPPPTWVRKPGLLRRPLLLSGLLELLLPQPDPVAESQPAGALQASGRVSGACSHAPRAQRWRQLSECSGQDLALLCWALGRLRMRPHGLMAGLFAEVRARLVAPLDGTPGEDTSPGGRGFGPRALAMAFWGLSSVGVWPSPAWQAAAAAAVLRRVRLGALGPHDLATVMAALAKWRRAPRVKQRRLRLGARLGQEELVLRRGGKTGAGLPDLGRRQHGGRVAHARTATAGSLRAYVAELSALALEHSAARMPVAPSPQYRLQSMPGQAANANVSGAQGNLQQQQQTPVPAPASATAAELQVYGARSLATLAWALACLGAVRALPDPWVAAFMPVSLRLLARLPPSHRVTMLDSLSRLGLRAGPDWREQAEQVVMDGGLALASSYGGLSLALRRMAGEGDSRDVQQAGERRARSRQRG